MIIHKEYGERDSIIEFSPENHATLKNYIKGQDVRHGFDLSQRYSSFNSYDCDDYLYVAWLIYRVVNCYNRMNRIPGTNHWRPGYKEVPYIHLELYEGNTLELVDGIAVPNDKRLGISVTGPVKNGCYVLKMDRFYLQRYILFLSDIFDQNQELFADLSDQEVVMDNGNVRRSDAVMTTGETTSKEDLLRKANNLLSQGAPDIAQALKNYALTLSDGAKVSMPAITVINGKFSGLSFVDCNRVGISVPLKKTIFNTSGFAKFFASRNDLIIELFEESFLAILSHEFAHVANGHCLLSANYPEYANQKNVRVCAEQNADDTAIRLRLSDSLFEGADGNPHNNKLALSRDRLIHTWAVRSFAMHLGLSWMYRGDDRAWDTGTLEAYLKDRNVQHPLYQFRTFNAINRMLDLLSCFPEKEWSGSIRTTDGYCLDQSLAFAAIKEATDLIYSFESCFETTYGEDKQSVEEMLKHSWRIEKESRPSTPNKTSFLMPIFNPNAMAEICTIKRTWPELKLRLEQSGTYSMLYRSI